MVCHAGRRVPRRMHGCNGESTDCKGIAIRKQLIELRSVTMKFRFGVEQVTEDVLYLGYMSANTNFSTEPLLQVGSG